MWRGYGDGYGAWGSEAELFVNGCVANGSNDAGTMCDMVVNGEDEKDEEELGMWRGRVAVEGRASQELLRRRVWRRVSLIYEIQAGATGGGQPSRNHNPLAREQQNKIKKQWFAENFWEKGRACRQDSGQPK